MVKIYYFESVDKAALGFLEATAVPILAPISRALAGVFNTLVDNYSPALAEIFPKFLKKLPRPSA